jgi:hypothetical protein
MYKRWRIISRQLSDRGPDLGGVPGLLSRGRHETKIESTDFIEIFASLKSRKVYLCL